MSQSFSEWGDDIRGSRKPTYPFTQAQMAQMPGYVQDLHWRAHDGRVCLRCEADWPCRGAKLQMRQLRPYTSAFWLLSDAEFLSRWGHATTQRPNKSAPRV